ncbi:MAG: hypothetical protein IPJ88_12475 [Myxococcales bacterium]|nr:MAG: hypothetical protein IPJ88_12475 [Myxococcales bacterium]
MIDPPSFGQSGRIEWVCFDIDTNTVRPLEECRSPSEADTYLPTNLRLHVLVTQQSRGEIAAIEIRDDAPTKSKRVDNDVRVPGYTYPAVGEGPSAVVVPPTRPQYSYIANFGSRDISVLPTEIFRRTTLPLNSETLPPLPLPASPTDMILSPDEQTLILALPELGSLALVAIAEDGSLSEPTIVALSLPTNLEPTLALEETSYQKVCPADAPVGEFSLRDAEPTRCNPNCDDAAPQPWTFELDKDSNHLLVSDTALPVVHVIDLDALLSQSSPAELDPIVVGSPVRAMALTPVVPRDFSSDCDINNPDAQQCVRYLYALDAVDGSVAVLDYDSGNLLVSTTAAKQRVDRIALDASARALSVVLPSYDTPLLCADDNAFAEDASAREFRGVFVAVALSSGVLNFIDVWDLDAPCRGGQSCTKASDDLDSKVYIKRHRPRLVALSTSEISLIEAPQISTRSSSATVNAEGFTEAELLPDLTPLESCSTGQARAYPLTSQSETLVVCAQADPWDRILETWTATWNGNIALASGGGGSLDSATHSMLSSSGFCSAGVLGFGNVADSALDTQSDPEAGYGGDSLWIISELPPSAPEGCEELVQTDLVGDDLPIVFAIERAFDEHLILSDQSIGSIQTNFSRVAECFGELVNYEVHTRDAYLVSGTESGVFHRVIARSDGLCTVDKNQSPTLQTRALVGRPYLSSALNFQIAQGAQGFQENEQVSIFFRMQRLYSRVAGDFGLSNTQRSFVGDGTLPSSMRYNSLNRKLYTVDSASAGVVQYDLSPLLAESFFD